MANLLVMETDTKTARGDRPGGFNKLFRQKGLADITVVLEKHGALEPKLPVVK